MCRKIGSLKPIAVPVVGTILSR